MTAWLRLEAPLGASGPTLPQHSHPELGPRPVSRQLFSKEANPWPLGSLCQCSVTHTALKCFLVFRGSSCAPLCYCAYCTHILFSIMLHIASCPSSGYQWKQSGFPDL